MKFFFKICFLASSISATQLTYDIDMSPYAGANNLLFSTAILESIQPFKDTSLGNRIARVSELILFYLPFNYFTAVVQHEVFGHGYRIRDINHGIVWVSSYHFTLPPPYGPGSATTNFYIKPAQITTTDLTCISMAGFEAQSILANATKFNWLEKNAIDGRQTVLYLVSQFGINLYAEATDDDFENDLFGYLYPLNLTYTESVLTQDRLRSLSWMNFADPFTFYSVYSWFFYMMNGKSAPIPMIPLLGWDYLLGTRLGLTPFGPEYFLDQYLTRDQKPIYFYLKAGNHAKNTYLGAGLYSPYFYQKKRWSFGGRIDVWHQPELLLFGEPPYSLHLQHQKRFGIATSMIYSYRKNRFLGCEGELGYKTKGFLPGYSLKNSAMLRVSYLATF